MVLVGAIMDPDETINLRPYIECDACGEANPQKRCARCRCAFYCSSECQKQHWTLTHKEECIPIDTMWARLAGVGELPPKSFVTQIVPVNTACGICLEEPIRQQVVLSGCKHAFCFACLKDWQAYSRQTKWHQQYEAESPVTKKKLASSSWCPFCRRDIEKSVVDDALEKAGLYAARAGRLKDNEAERKEWYELALTEVDKLFTADERDIRALCIKGQILQHYAPSDSVNVYERVLELDCEGSANLEKISAMLDVVKVAMDAGNDDEAERLMVGVEAFHTSDALMSQVGSGPRRLIPVKILLAEAHEAVGNWEQARETYVDMLKETFEEDPATADAPQNRMLFSGVSRCFYHLGVHDRAIAAGEAALAMNRHFPGVHKLIALPQLALGEEEAAKKTMRRGVVYETPWDETNRQENIALLKDLLLRDDEVELNGGAAGDSSNNT